MKEEVNVLNFKGVDLILYKQAYEFVLSTGGSVADAHLAGLKKVKSRYKLRNEMKRAGVTY